MNDSAKSNIGMILSITGALVGVIGLVFSYATNRDKFDEFLCKSEFLRLNCSAKATLDFLYVEGWAYLNPFERNDLWNWGETNESRSRLWESESVSEVQGRSKSYPLRCGQVGFEAQSGLDMQNAVITADIPFGPLETNQRPPYPSTGPLDIPPPGYDDAMYSRLAYWRLVLDYRESKSDRDFVIKEVINPPLALADENADHSVRNFNVRSGPEHKSCTIYIPLVPRESGTYHVDLTISGDIIGAVSGDVTFQQNRSR